MQAFVDLVMDLQILSNAGDFICLVEDLLASQEGFCSMEFISIGVSVCCKYDVRFYCPLKIFTRITVECHEILRSFGKCYVFNP